MMGGDVLLLLEVFSVMIMQVRIVFKFVSFCSLQSSAFIPKYNMKDLSWKRLTPAQMH
jgi:hypothetical protein